MHHIRTSQPLELSVAIRDIVGLDLGFDNLYCFFMNPTWFGPHSKLLCISYMDRNAVTTTCYVFADFDPGLAVNPHSRNDEFFEALGNRIAEMRADKKA